MSNLIYNILTLLKWPFAIVMLMLFWPTLIADISLVTTTFSMVFFLKFILPLLCTIAFFMIFHTLVSSHFLVFEHELTHSLVAMICFVPTKSMQIKRDHGYVKLGKKSNWLICLSPYIWPTYISILIGTQIILELTNKPISQDTALICSIALGILSGYRIMTNIKQIHPNQTDFATAGYLFTFLVLPTANLIIFGTVWSFAANGLHGLTQWLGATSQEIHIAIRQLIHLCQSII